MPLDLRFCQRYRDRPHFSGVFMSNGIIHSALELWHRRPRSFKLCISIVQGGEEIIIIVLTMYAGLTADAAILQSPFPRRSSQGPCKHCISHKCYCLGLLFIVKNKSYNVLKKDSSIRP